MVTQTDKSAAGATPLQAAPELGVADLRLLQLLSPTIPTGAFNFSQGLEWAVHAGWVSTEEDFQRWLLEQLQGLMVQQELPLLATLHAASVRQAPDELLRWANWAVALRDTSELRTEEVDRAGALLRVLEALGVPGLESVASALEKSQLAGIAWAAARWSLPLNSLLRAYAYSWLEQQIAAGVKLIPLGQSQGQRLLFSLANSIPDSVVSALTVEVDEIGYSSPAISLASCSHETQYTRLYRS
ncbi:MAG: urease accessory protein UreF [Gammaproteobacteria bacterium]|nr:urease accessory protein UreF [Gammaproteobacteria bacterium]